MDQSTGMIQELGLILNSVKSDDDEVSRSDIIERIEKSETEYQIIDFIELLDNEYFSEAIKSDDPIVFEVSSLVSLLEEFSDQSLIVAVDISKINAAADPNLTNMIETESYKKLKPLIKKESPIRIYISGETGLGKSTAVMRIAQSIGMEVIRVNLSYATDVDDLMGGLRLNASEDGGGTRYHKGPVLEAMERGAILLLDEVDAANPRILMELQPVLEGKGVLVKKINEMVFPKKGFRVIATGNSKGRGDTTGKYVGLSPLNAAFLDRFDVFLSFDPPTKNEMRQIIKMATEDKLNAEIYECLAEWYQQIKSGIEGGGIDLQEISTRRMIAISSMFVHFDVEFPEDDEAHEAVKHGTSIYDAPVAAALWNTWDSMLKMTQAERKSRRGKVDSGDDDDESSMSFFDKVTSAVKDEDGNVLPF